MHTNEQVLWHVQGIQILVSDHSNVLPAVYI